MSSLSSRTPRAAPISAESGALWPRLLLCGALYCVGVSLAELRKDDVGSDAWLVILHVASSSTLFLIWAKFGRPSDRFSSFGAALLFATACFRAIAAVDAAVVGARLEDWPERVFQTQAGAYQNIIEGEVVADVGMVLVALSWLRVVQSRRLNMGIIPGRELDKSFWIVIYLLGLAVEVARLRLGIDLGGLTQFMNVFHYAGIVAIFSIASNNDSVFMRVVVALCAGLPLSYAGSASGMKENMLFSLVPAAYFAWTGWSRPFHRAVMVLTSFLVIALLQPYVALIRQTAWIEQRSLSTSEILTLYQSQFDQQLLYRGINEAALRLNLTNSRAYTMSVAERGFQPDEVFGGLATIFVPRFFWPDKPTYDPGVMHTARLYGEERLLGEVRSATAAGFLNELYLGGGVLGAIFGSLIFGSLTGLLQTAVNRLGGPAGVYVQNFALLYLAIRLDETAVVYAFSGSIAFALYLIPASLIWNLFKAGKAASKARLAQARDQ